MRVERLRHELFTTCSAECNSNLLGDVLLQTRAVMVAYVGSVGRRSPKWLNKNSASSSALFLSLLSDPNFSHISAGKNKLQAL